MIDDTKYYLGSLCKREHDHEGTGKSLRLRSNCGCVKCEAINIANRRRKNLDKFLAREREYNRKHPGHRGDKEKFRKYAKTYRALNKEARNKYNSEWLKTPKGRLLTKVHSHKRRVRDSLAGKISSEIIRKVQWICDDVCVYCGATENLSLDHFVALAKGGANKPSNFLIACVSCNSSKRDHDAWEWYFSQPFYSSKRWYKICYILEQLKNLE